MYDIFVYWSGRKADFDEVLHPDWTPWRNIQNDIANNEPPTATEIDPDINDNQNNGATNGLPAGTEIHSEFESDNNVNVHPTETGMMFDFDVDFNVATVDVAQSNNSIDLEFDEKFIETETADILTRHYKEH